MSRVGAGIVGVLGATVGGLLGAGLGLHFSGSKAIVGPMLPREKEAAAKGAAIGGLLGAGLGAALGAGPEQVKVVGVGNPPPGVSGIQAEWRLA